MPFEHYKEQIRELTNNEIELIAIDDGECKCRKGTFVHNGEFGCGKSFSVNLQLFMEKPKCRKCQLMKVSVDKTGEEFGNYIKEKVKTYVGDEYEVVNYKGYGKSMEIRHKKCNMITKIIPSGFFNGSRCSFCSGLIRTEWITKIIGECTDNNYSVEGWSEEHDNIQVKGPNGEIKTASPSYFLQELIRPTESEYFAIRKKRPEYPLSPKAKVYLEIVDWCKNHKVWIVDQHVHSEELESTHNSLLKLKRMGLIKNVYWGIYTVNENVQFLDVLKEKYLINNIGERIGIFSEDTAAYVYGITDTKPVRYKAMSNIYTAGGIYACLGEEAFITGIKTKINDSNYMLLTGLQLAKYSLNHPEAEENVRRFWKEHNISIGYMNIYASIFGPFFKRQFIREFVKNTSLVSA